MNTRVLSDPRVAQTTRCLGGAAARGVAAGLLSLRDTDSKLSVPPRASISCPQMTQMHADRSFICGNLRVSADPSSRPPRLCGDALRRGGFTLVEMLVALAITLLLMISVATIFSSVSDSIRDGRTTIEMSDRLRGVQNRLRADLEGVTVITIPPRRPENDEGYLEIIEGPMGPVVIPGAFLSGGEYELEFAGLIAPTNEDADGDGKPDPDTTVGDLDDVLMFTTRNLREPFIGRFAGGTQESRVAEVAWFVRGTTLYRRVLLVKLRFVLPGNPTPVPLPLAASGPNFYADYDISVHEEGHATYDRSPSPGTHRLVANTLGDLTKRENRYGHQPYAFPHDARFWHRLGLPTLRECSSAGWPFPWTDNAPTQVTPLYYGDSKSILIGPTGPTVVDILGGTQSGLSRIDLIGPDQFDAWTNPHPWTDHVDPITGTLQSYGDRTRVAEDVILTNVLSFDVKVWDPGAPVLEATDGSALLPGDPGYIQRLIDLNSGGVNVLSYGAYVDLNYMCRLGTGGINTYLSNLGPLLPRPLFHWAGDARSRLRGTEPNVNIPLPDELLPAVYDTWSFHYERDGFDQDQDGLFDEGTNGFDDDGTGGVDDAGDLNAVPPVPGELEAPPPYPYPLRGIQVKIRTFDPDSRQIREVTVEQEFLPE